jgi:hypothetical protein
MTNPALKRRAKFSLPLRGSKSESNVAKNQFVQKLKLRTNSVPILLRFDLAKRVPSVRWARRGRLNVKPAHSMSSQCTETRARRCPCGVSFQQCGLI